MAVYAVVFVRSARRELEALPAELGELPYTRRAKKDIAWLGKISLGMGEDKLLEALKQNSWIVTKTADGWLVKGCSPLTSMPLYPLREWTARFQIEEQALVGMGLDARSETK